jgi:hypothetical protein
MISKGRAKARLMSFRPSRRQSQEDMDSGAEAASAGKKATHSELDTAGPLRFPAALSAAGAERAGLQSGESVAAAGFAERD